MSKKVIKVENIEDTTSMMLFLDAIVDNLNSFKSPEEAVEFMKKELAKPKVERHAQYAKELTAIKKQLKRSSWALF